MSDADARRLKETAYNKKSAAERVSRALKLEELIQFQLLSSKLAERPKAAAMPSPFEHSLKSIPANLIQIHSITLLLRRHRFIVAQQPFRTTQ